MPFTAQNPKSARHLTKADDLLLLKLTKTTRPDSEQSEHGGVFLFLYAHSTKENCRLY